MNDNLRAGGDINAGDGGYDVSTQARYEEFAKQRNRMMNERFSDLLKEYLDERDRQNSDYYDNRFIGSRHDGAQHMEELAQKMDALIHGVE